MQGYKGRSAALGRFAVSRALRSWRLGPVSRANDQTGLASRCNRRRVPPGPRIPAKVRMLKGGRAGREGGMAKGRGGG